MQKISQTHSLSSSIVATIINVGIGIAVGFVLPPLWQRLRRKLVSSSSSPSTNTAGDHVHAVRDGLAQDGIRIPRATLDGLVSQILIKAGGCTPEGAALTANVLSFADVRGIPSHGVNRVDAYVNEIAAGLVDAQAQPVVEKQSGACAVVNGKNALGVVVSKLAMETAIALCREYGVAVVTCHSSNHYGAAGYWAQMAALEPQQRLIALSFTNTSPIAFPTRSCARGLGTNPFCCFCPATTTTAGDDDNDNNNNKATSFQLDMATTTVPMGKIEVMHRLGKAVPKGWGVDRYGNDCTNAKEICQDGGGLYPLGGPEETAGYKGYGLGMFVEILCSVLSGASIGPNVPPWNLSRGRPLNYGHCFIVIDPKRFHADFESRLGQYMDRMRNLPGDNVLVPGDPEKEYERDAQKHGILLHSAVATMLKALAEKYSVPVPNEMEALDESQAKASLYE